MSSPSFWQPSGYTSPRPWSRGGDAASVLTTPPPSEAAPHYRPSAPTSSNPSPSPQSYLAYSLQLARDRLRRLGLDNESYAAAATIQRRVRRRTASKKQTHPVSPDTAAAAALMLQSHVRGRQVRANEQQQRRAAVAVQAHLRGHHVRSLTRRDTPRPGAYFPRGDGDGAMEGAADVKDDHYGAYEGEGREEDAMERRLAALRSGLEEEQRRAAAVAVQARARGRLARATAGGAPSILATGLCSLCQSRSRTRRISGSRMRPRSRLSAAPRARHGGGVRDGRGGGRRVRAALRVEGEMRLDPGMIAAAAAAARPTRCWPAGRARRSVDEMIAASQLMSGARLSAAQLTLLQHLLDQERGAAMAAAAAATWGWVAVVGGSRRARAACARHPPRPRGHTCRLRSRRRRGDEAFDLEDSPDGSDAEEAEEEEMAAGAPETVMGVHDHVAAAEAEAAALREEMARLALEAEGYDDLIGEVKQQNEKRAAEEAEAELEAAEAELAAAEAEAAVLREEMARLALDADGYDDLIGEVKQQGEKQWQAALAVQAVLGATPNASDRAGWSHG